VGVETEIKLRLRDGVERTKARLQQLGYITTGPRQLETDQTFDLPTGELRRGDRLLRLRSSGGTWRLTYKGPANRDGHKTREEIEADISDGVACAEILAALGYKPAFAYEKYRTTFVAPGFVAPGEDGIVTLDETPIGDFLELEGPEYWIDRTAAHLGFASSDYITSSYGALYEEYRRTHEVPADMKFHLP
jgi:adenylate cyclase, class 2